ncbi:hypothetical protein [Flindersiella endophytica]
MAYAPANPYPKGRGDSIRSADWNEAINELIRLENDKFNKSGGTVSGNLTVTGTISGTLANNIVGPNQIAANAVTTAKIADGNVTTAELAVGSVTTDRIADAAVGTVKLDGFLAYNGALSIAGSGTALVGFAGEFLDSNPRFYNLLAFPHGTVNDSYITWSFQYYTYEAQVGRFFSSPYLLLTNLRSAATQIHLRVWALRGPA